MKVNKMRYLGLDLGVKSLGISITDKTNTMAYPLKVLHFKWEDYAYVKEEVLKLVKEYNISKVVLGLPKNMDGSSGFAAQRSLKLKEMLQDEVEVILVDERLTTKSAEDIIHLNNKKVKDGKKKIDALAATIILETYLASIKDKD